MTEWRNFWSLPLAAAFGYSISILHIYSISPFMQSLQQEFGWSRAQISMGITVASVGSAVFCVPMGMLVDRIGPRLIGLIGTLLMAVAYGLLSTATGEIGNWLMLWGFLAVAAPWVQSTTWTSAVASRFASSRGLAFAVTLSGASAGATVFPILATWLIGLYGWRAAFVATSAIWTALVFPVLFFFFRGVQNGNRKARRAAPDAARVLTGLSLSEGLRLPAFYKLLLAGSLFAFGVIGILVHFVPLLRDSGAAPLAAASIASLIGIFAIIGRLFTGLLLDRLAAHLVGAGVFLLAIIACALLLLDSANPICQVAASAIFGLTLGAEIDVIAYLATRHFGLKNFGGLFGGLVAALTLGAAFGPLAAGATFDRYGAYTPFLVLTMISMAASSITLATLHRPAFAAQDESTTSS